MKRIAVVILNYNTNEDLFDALFMIERQSAHPTVIIVDNDSKKVNRHQLHIWGQGKGTDCMEGSPSFFLEGKGLDRERKYYIIYNDNNAGYSAGNNIGLKFTEKLGIPLCLVINPDVRLYDPDYIKIMANTLEQNDDYVVAGSYIKNLDGQSQNPLRLRTFYEEFFWFFVWLHTKIKKIEELQLFIYPTSGSICTVPNLHGCCMMLDMEFMSQCGYFDERVFMYSEESILAAKVRRANKKMLYVANVEAVHAHVRSEKEDSSLRMLTSIKSNLHYIRNYTNYNTVQKALLHLSYGILYLLHKIKYRIKRVFGGIIYVV